MRIKGTSVPDCKYCENSELIQNDSIICKLGLDKSKCKKYKYDIFRYEPQKNILDGKFSKEDFEI